MAVIHYQNHMSDFPLTSKSSSEIVYGVVFITSMGSWLCSVCMTQSTQLSPGIGTTLCEVQSDLNFELVLAYMASFANDMPRRKEVEVG